MKKKIYSAMLTMTVTLSAVISQAVPAQAGSWAFGPENGDVQIVNGENVGTFDDPNILANDLNSYANIPVKMAFGEGGGICYEVKVDFGAMEFKYDYGSKWDPSTHSYTLGESGNPNGGWVKSYLDNTSYTSYSMSQLESLPVTNNMIKVTNLSNYPITADFAFTQGANAFNANPAAADAVKGIFNKDNLALYTDVTNNVTSPTVVDTLSLDWDYSPAEDASMDHYNLSTDSKDNIGLMFFSLIGKPDRNLTWATSSMQSVGNITITISPASNATLYH